MLDQAVKGNLDKCIKCGLCVASCPVANNCSSFAGPKHMGPELTRFRLDPRLELEQQVDYCCNCRSCEQACPSGVKVSLLNAYYKSHWKTKAKVLSLRDNMLGRPGVLAQLSTIQAGVTNFMLQRQLIKLGMEKVLRISKHASFPAYQKESFVQWFSNKPKFTSDKKVIYFVGCSTNYNMAEIGKSVVEIMEHNGYQVIVPKQGCCGLPLIANGYLEAAKKQGQENLASFKPYIEQGYPVIANCTTCGLALKDEYGEMLELPHGHDLARQVYDFSEFLVEMHQRGELNTDFRPVPLKVAYHEPCHLKAQGIGQPSLELLAMIPQLQVEEIDQGCCGLSGSYGFKQEKYQVAMDIGKSLFAKVADIAPDYVITDCNSCAMQLNHGSDKETIHPATLIARAYKNN